MIKFKKLHENAVLPKHIKKGDAGVDLTAVSVVVQGLTTTFYTGLAVEIPKGHVGLLFPRSSICNTPYTLANAVGVIDENYRGEILIKMLLNTSGLVAVIDGSNWPNNKYAVGDRVAQLVIVPYVQVEAVWANELSVTDRGANGFGSTGVK